MILAEMQKEKTPEVERTESEMERMLLQGSLPDSRSSAPPQPSYAQHPPANLTVAPLSDGSGPAPLAPATEIQKPPHELAPPVSVTPPSTCSTSAPPLVALGEAGDLPTRGSFAWHPAASSVAPETYSKMQHFPPLPPSGAPPPTCLTSASNERQNPRLAPLPPLPPPLSNRDSQPDPQGKHWRHGGTHSLRGLTSAGDFPPLLT
jgi:hypothetical protein